MSEFERYQKKAERLKLLEELYEATLELFAKTHARMDVRDSIDKVQGLLNQLSRTRK